MRFTALKGTDRFVGFAFAKGTLFPYSFYIGFWKWVATTDNDTFSPLCEKADRDG